VRTSRDTNGIVTREARKAVEERMRGKGSSLRMCAVYLPDLHGACDALEESISRGWGNSSVVWSKAQEYHDAPCLYQGNCSGHGENVLGVCFCAPGFDGKACAQRDQTRAWPACTHRDDRCFYSPVAGVMAVSAPRWRQAQRAESAWAASQRARGLGAPKFDEAEEHMRDFEGYQALGPRGTNLGTVLEIGAGPWTQSVPILRARNFTAKKLILLEPNARRYAESVNASVYQKGVVDIGAGGLLRPVIISSGVEEMAVARGTVDTIVMVNILEHVRNAPAALRFIYNMLAPNGRLVFCERWWDHIDRLPERFSLNIKRRAQAFASVDRLLHPIRLKRAVIDQFLLGFEPLYEAQNEFSSVLTHLRQNGTYFIGRKRPSQEVCTANRQGSQQRVRSWRHGWTRKTPNNSLSLSHSKLKATSSRSSSTTPASASGSQLTRDMARGSKRSSSMPRAGRVPSTHE
jgi:SAM-dependent methyltransferase